MRPAESGFTLVEVLVALVVSAFLLAIVLDGAATARSRTAAQAEKMDAIRLGQSTLIRAVANAEAGEEQGREGSLTWRSSERTIGADTRGFWHLNEVRVDVSSSDGKSLQSFSTRKLRRTLQ